MANANTNVSDHSSNNGIAPIATTPSAAAATALPSSTTTTSTRGHSDSAPSTSDDRQQQSFYQQQHPSRGHSESAVPNNHHHSNTTAGDVALAVVTGASPLTAAGGVDGDTTGSAAFGWANNDAASNSGDLSSTDTVPTQTTGGRANTTTVESPSAATAASGSSLLFGKPSNGSVLLGKSSSLIFPTGVEPSTSAGRNTSIGSVGRGSSNASSSDYAANNLKRRKVNLLLDQCETVRFPFRKKLILNDLALTAADIPVKDLCGTPLGQSLHKLSLAGNRLGYIPGKLVTNLPVLKHLDLSQCELHHLPEIWYLPNLRRLNLSHNRLTDFPEEVSTKSI